MAKFSGPEDSQMILIILSLLTAYYGSEEFWLKEYDIFGSGNKRMSHLMLYFIFTWIISSTIIKLMLTLYAERNTEHFQKRFKMRSFISHTTYMLALILVYFSYTQLTGSTVLNEYPKLTNLAYGGEFLQATLRCMVCNVAC